MDVKLQCKRTPGPWRFTAMGSPCAIHLVGLDADRRDVVVQALRRRLEALEARYSRYRPDSLVSEINRRAGTAERLRLDDEAAGLLDYAAVAWEQSGGLFDITSGVLRRVWDFRTGQLPTPDQVTSVLRCVGFDKLEWQRPFLRLPIAGMELDFGGVVKEFAVDQLVGLARAMGAGHGWVDLGGDVGIVGPQPDGRPWRIGLRDGTPDTVRRVVRVTVGAIASSGDYERGMTVDGVRYGHVLNPLTGWPVRGVRAVSVLGADCLVAGSASTIALLKGAEAMAWLESLALPWLLVDEHGVLHGPLVTAAAGGAEPT